MALRPIIGSLYRSDSGAMEPLIAGFAYQNGSLKPIINGQFVNTGGGGGTPPVNVTPPSISGGVAEVTTFDFTGLTGANFVTGGAGLQVILHEGGTNTAQSPWFNAGSESLPPGGTIEVVIEGGSGDIAIATAFANALLAFSSGTVWSATTEGAIATVTNLVVGAVDDASSGNAPVVVTVATQGGFPVGTTLTRTEGVWTDADTITGIWQHDQGTGTWLDIAGETGATYDVQAAYVGEMIRYYETATNGAGSASEPSNELGPVAFLSFVTGQTLDSLRTDGAGLQVGFRFTVDVTGVTIRALGRYNHSGDSQTHTLYLCDSTGAVLASVALDASLGTPGGIQYANLASPVAVTQGNTYAAVSQEFTGGDSWADQDTTLTTTAIASVISAVYQTSVGGSLNATGAANNSYGPTGFLYTTE